MENTLYWLYNPTTKLTKIGITENLDQRLKQIENACGCEVKLVAYATFEHASITERFLLSLLSNCRTKGEWINCNKYPKSFQIIYDTFHIITLSKSNRDSFFDISFYFDIVDVIDIYGKNSNEVTYLMNHQFQ